MAIPSLPQARYGQIQSSKDAALELTNDQADCSLKEFDDLFIGHNADLELFGANIPHIGEIGGLMPSMHQDAE